VGKVTLNQWMRALAVRFGAWWPQRLGYRRAGMIA
jgi:hypothetical protein